MTQCTKCQQQDGTNNGHCDCKDPVCSCCKTSVADLLNKNTEALTFEEQFKERHPSLSLKDHMLSIEVPFGHSPIMVDDLFKNDYHEVFRPMFFFAHDVDETQLDKQRVKEALEKHQECERKYNQFDCCVCGEGGSCLTTMLKELGL